VSATIPDSHKDLLDGPVVVTVATVMPNSQPQLSVVWCNRDGDHILLNSARGRQKDRNIAANPRVTLLAVDPEDPYRFIEVRGAVVEITEEGAVDHISELSRLYTGKYPYYGGFAPAERQNKETRVLYRIEPTRVRVE
jgi:PPOX class probable F420-dependent enzyme